MEAAAPRERAVVLSDDDDFVVAIELVLDRCGYDFEVAVPNKDELVNLAAFLLPQLAVVDLTLAGMGGLTIVSALRDRAPALAVVLLCPFENLHEAALRVGAVDLLHSRDLVGLQRCLERLRAGVATVCTCQPILRSVNTSTAFNPGASRLSGPSFGNSPAPPG